VLVPEQRVNRGIDALTIDRVGLDHAAVARRFVRRSWIYNESGGE
jgi:hypothetical protein